jgi:hypothetical protein
MSTYDDNPNAAGGAVTITADDTLGRRSRAAQIRQAARTYARAHGVTLTLISRAYSEAHGFLSRSSFTYEITRAGVPAGTEEG